MAEEPMVAGLHSALVSDALDELGLREQVMDSSIAPITADTVIAGTAFPAILESTDEVLTPHSPYESEIRAVQALGPGQVSVYGAPEGNRAAVWGELFSYAAMARGAVGAIVDGYIRDTRQLREMGYPVFSRGASPLDTRYRARVQAHGVPVTVGGVLVHPGDFVVGDSDGVVVVPQGVLSQVREHITQRIRDEGGAKQDLRSGSGMDEVWKKWQVF